MSLDTLYGGTLTCDGTIQQLIENYPIDAETTLLRADADNAGNVYLYNTDQTVQIMYIDAGETLSIDVPPHKIYVSGTSSDILWWTAVGRSKSL